MGKREEKNKTCNNNKNQIGDDKSIKQPVKDIMQLVINDNYFEQ